MKNLKKLCALALACVMLLGLAACGSDSADSASDGKTVTELHTEGYKVYEVKEIPELEELKKNATGRLADVLAAGKIVCVSEVAFAPYEYIDPDVTDQQSSYVGADMELARYIAAHLGVELEIVNAEFSTVLSGIPAGKYDMAVSALGYTPERDESMNLSDGYRFEENDQHGFLVPADKVDDYQTIEDFYGLRIAYQLGSLQEMYANSQIEDMESQSYEAVQTAVLALQSGKCDAVAVSCDNGEQFAAANDDIVLSSVRFATEPIGICVACKKGEDDLTAAINLIIAQQMEEGLYEDWWGTATARATELGLD